LTFYADSKTREADIASDAAPRKHAPAPTQPELFNFNHSDKVAELNAITRTDADGMSLYILVTISSQLVFILKL